MAEWSSTKILDSSFITHSTPNGYEIHFATPDREQYLAVQDECRRQIGHAKPTANADRIRSMTDVDVPIYDKEETYTNCTVQVLTNTETGEVSIGWWQNE